MHLRLITHEVDVWGWIAAAMLAAVLLVAILGTVTGQQWRMANADIAVPLVTAAQ